MNRRQRRRAAALGLWHVVAALSAFYLALLVWLSVIALVPSLFGWTPYVITTGSMAPRIPSGTVLVAGPPPDHLVAPGGVVVFADARGRSVTHRVVAVDSEVGYRTKGDANPLADTDAVAVDQVLGVGRIVVPLLGLPVVWLLQGRWTLTALAVVASVVACWVGWRSIRAAAGDASRGAGTADARREDVTMPRAYPEGRRRHTLGGVGLVVGAVVSVVAVGWAVTLAAGTFVAEAQQPTNRWAASDSFDPVGTSVTAGDLPRAAASASQTFTFTFDTDLPPGAQVRIDLTEPFRGPVDYRGAEQPLASVGAATLETRRGNSPIREAEITWVAPAGGVVAGTTVTITVPSGIITADVEVEGLPATFTRVGTGAVYTALFAVR